MIMRVKENDHANIIVVGYALTSKKIKSFLQPKLEGLARYFIYFS